MSIGGRSRMWRSLLVDREGCNVFEGSTMHTQLVGLGSGRSTDGDVYVYSSVVAVLRDGDV